MGAGSRAGNPWVRLTTTDSTASFDVFNGDGRYLGNVTSTDRVAPYPPPVIRQNRFHAVVRDSLDVPHIVRYDIRRGR